MPLAELTLQLDLAVRLVVAAVLGAAIGLEREIHDHPAGMRTHLLVSLGAAIFTELSIYSFQPPGGGTGALPTDPSRIAAQVVSGIGFLGAGAILKYGTSIRGLTTAASLGRRGHWHGRRCRGVGHRCGRCGHRDLLLWPLNVVINRLRLRDSRSLRVRLTLARLEALGGVSKTLAVQRVEISGINTQRLGKGRYEIELVLHLPPGTSSHQIIDAVTAVEGVELIESQVGTD